MTSRMQTPSIDLSYPTHIGIPAGYAGISRFFPTGDYIQLRIEFVSKAIVEDKFMIPLGSEKLNQMFSGQLAKFDRDTFIGSNENIVSGGVFISSPGKLEDLVESTINNFVSKELMEKQRVDNEQIALAEDNLNWFGMLPSYIQCRKSVTYI